MPIRAYARTLENSSPNFRSRGYAGRGEGERGRGGATFLVPHAGRNRRNVADRDSLLASTTRQYRAFTDCAVRRPNNIRGDAPCIRYAACMSQHPLTAASSKGVSGRRIVEGWKGDGGTAGGVLFRFERDLALHVSVTDPIFPSSPPLSSSSSSSFPSPRYESFSLFLSSISKISDLPTRFVTVDAHYSDSELFVIEGGGGGGLEKSKRVDRFSAVSSFASFFARSFARYLFLPLCIRILLLLLRSPEFN